MHVHTDHSPLEESEGVVEGLDCGFSGQGGGVWVHTVGVLLPGVIRAVGAGRVLHFRWDGEHGWGDCTWGMWRN